jgi:hypothetical protein
MFPFHVDPRWYDEYWLNDRPRPPPAQLPGRLLRLAVLVALLVGSGLALSHVHRDAAGYQDWEQE